MAEVSSTGSKVIIEGVIPKADPSWKFKIGEEVFTIDGVGFIKLFLVEEWQDTERQRFLLMHNCIYKTSEQAEARQRHLMRVAIAIDEVEAE